MQPHDFFLSVLEHLESVIGERSTEALVRFASVEAAAQAGAGVGPSLGRILAEYGRFFGWDLALVRATTKEATVHVTWNRPSSGPVARAIAQGLVHGMFLAATRARAAEAAVEEMGDGSARVTVRRTA